MALCRKWRRNLAQPLVHRFRDGNGSLENSFSPIKRVRLEAILFFFVGARSRKVERNIVEFEDKFDRMEFFFF